MDWYRDLAIGFGLAIAIFLIVTNFKIVIILFGVAAAVGVLMHWLHDDSEYGGLSLTRQWIDRNVDYEEAQ